MMTHYTSSPSMDENFHLSAVEEFPFPYTPYPTQSQLMDTLYKCLEERRVGIFESPTGTGKSLSALCSTLTWLIHNEARNATQLVQRKALLNEVRAKTDTATDWVEAHSQYRKLANEINPDIDSAERQQKLQSILQEIRQSTSTDPDFKPPSSKISDEESLDETVIPGLTKIFYCTRTHSQVQQVFDEFLKTSFADHLSVITLGSRKQLCVNEKVTSLKSVDAMNETCLDMQRKASKKKESSSSPVAKRRRCGTNAPTNSDSKCPYLQWSRVEELGCHFLSHPTDIEDMAEKGREKNACPYYASRQQQRLAHLVVLTYQTLLHTPTRVANGIDLRGSCVVIDEAHNLLDTLSSMQANEVTLRAIEGAHSQMQMYLEKYRKRLGPENLLSVRQVISLLACLVEFFQGKLAPLPTGSKDAQMVFTQMDFIKQTGIDDFDVTHLIQFIHTTKFVHKLTQFATPSSSGGGSNTLTKAPLFKVVSFLEQLAKRDEDCRIMLTVNVDTKEVRAKHLALSPAKYLADVIQQSRAVVLLGGTMEPVKELQQQLIVHAGCAPDRLQHFSCTHVIPSNQILTIAVRQDAPSSQPLLDFRFQSRQEVSLLTALGGLIQSLSGIIPGGMVVFFSSYEYQDYVYNTLSRTQLWQQLWRSDHRATFREPRSSEPGGTAAGDTLEKILHDYRTACGSREKPGRALLLSVMGGKLSEGINFSDHLGRAVVVVGMPYAHQADPQIVQQMRHMDACFGSGAGQRYYEGACMKTVNQAIGRAIRHVNDYAAVWLVDERYSRDSILAQLPRWMAPSIEKLPVAKALHRTKEFFDVLQQDMSHT